MRRNVDGGLSSKYYYKIEDYQRAYPERIKTKRLQEWTKHVAFDIAKKNIHKILALTHSSKGIYIHWTSRDTFGFILTDFEKPGGARYIIGKGRKQLFEKIKDDYYCVVISDSLPHNFRTFEIEEGKTGIIINIDYFKRFSEVIRYENFVGLFLYKFDTEEVGRIIRSWITDSPERFKKLIEEQQITFTDVANMLENYKIESLDELSNFLRFTTKIIKSRIEQNYYLFEARLEEFKELVDKEKKLEESNYTGRKNIENEIRNFLRINPWIIDFTYDEKSVESKIHKDADVILVESYLNLKKAVILEIKVPTDDTLKKYRGKDAFKVIIPNAISQVIHYMVEAMDKSKEKNNSKIIVEGLVVVGRYEEDFVWIFNQFLHGITITTYQELYDDTKRRLDHFAKGPSIKT